VPGLAWALPLTQVCSRPHRKIGAHSEVDAQARHISYRVKDKAMQMQSAHPGLRVRWLAGRRSARCLQPPRKGHRECATMPFAT